MPEDVMTPELIAFVKQQKDRHEIYECLLRYTRGVDRHDTALMQSAYHPDAFNDYGTSEGSPSEFCNGAIGWHREFQTRHQHIITNHTVDIDGTTAHAETYYMFWGDNRDAPPTLAFGRYVDRFEKRNGKWAIAYRVCIHEKGGQFLEVEYPKEVVAKMSSTGPNRRDKEDISYVRPLTRERASR
jgi:hypothetical protein